jgi:hypothetical protein
MLHGHTNGGLDLSFLRAGTLLVSTGREVRTWLWDAALRRSWFNLTGSLHGEFRCDGRIAVELDGRLGLYEVDAALEYRTSGRDSGRSSQHWSVSVRPDGRVAAVSTDRGVLLCVATPVRIFRVGPLNDCRQVAVSADGKWWATENRLVGPA